MGRPKKPIAIGERFGSLRVVGEASASKLVTQCNCGRMSIVDRHNLTSGRTKSCWTHRVDPRLPLRFKITRGEYDAALLAQGGCCAVCGCAPANGKRLVVDHCHETNRFRALLCDGCNLMLGHAKDDESRLLSAVMYLRRQRSN